MRLKNHQQLNKPILKTLQGLMAPSTKYLKEETDLLQHSKGSSPDYLLEQDLVKKRKSKSPSINYVKKAKHQEDNEDGSEDIAKQYKKFSGASKFNLNSEEVFCVCRRPDYGGELMVLCDGCEEWFHFKCMKLNKQYSKLVARFYCKFCEWKSIGYTQWKRKCRLDWCWEPARADSKSKYCCEEHGIIFLKTKLLDCDKTIGDIKSEEIKSTLVFIDGDLEKLDKLGSSFPELPEVIEFKSNKESGQFPEYIKKDLSEKNERVEKINQKLSLCQIKSRYLLRLKERIKIINDKLSQVQGEDASETTNKKSKKSKAKKIDLCYYDKQLSQTLELNDSSKYLPLIDSQDIYQDFKQEIDDIIAYYEQNKDGDSFNGPLCIKDRRKCSKHNGWWNLVNDELFKHTTELSTKLESLENEKSLILKEYSIQVYEGKNK